MQKTLLFLSFFICLNLFSQIESGKTIPKNKDKEKEIKLKKIKPIDTTQTNFIFFTFSQGNSFRKFNITDEFFSSKFENNLKEKEIKTSNFHLELKTPVKNNFFIQFGIANQNYGESFEKTGDTSFIYTTKYKHFSVPIKLGVEHGKKLKFFISSGFQLQMLASYKKIETLKIPQQKESEEIFKTDSNLRPLSLAFNSNAGIVYRFNAFSFALSAEYIRQLNSTYLPQKAYSHKPYFYGVNIGIGFTI